MEESGESTSLFLWPRTWVILAIILLFNLSNAFNFYCKLTIYYFFILFSSTLAIIPACFRPFEVTNTLIVGWILRVLCKPFGVKWKIHGEEHLKTPGPAVILCNHQSAVDVMGMMHLWPVIERCVPIIKRELQYALSFGLLATLCGSVFIDRFNSDKARSTVNKTTDYLREKNCKVWVFPEGTRNCNDTMLPFKKGAFHLAVQGELPIIPMVFSSYSEFYNQEKKIFQPGTVHVHVLPPVSTKGMSTSDVNDLVERVRSQMLKVFREVSNITPTEINGLKK